MGVQVKSTMSELRQNRDQRPGCFSVTVRHSSRPPYKLSDFQLLAVYVIPKDVWYIIPFAEVMARKTILLRPGDPPDNGYERYREAWHLLCELPPVKSGSVKPKPYRLKSDGMPKVSAKK